MKPVLVTGATGFVGWHIARLLLSRGERVRVLARNPAQSQTALSQLVGVEIVRGDLRDPSSLDTAVSQCSTVFHVAADYRLWVPKPDEMYASNVDGTRNLLTAARNAGVERVVYTSTVGCIGLLKHEFADERTPVSIDDMHGPYKRTKFQAEQVALNFARDGFPVVIVNPTTPLGDHDFRPTPTGKMIVDFLRGAMPAFLDTGLNIVDVEDVAYGHLAARAFGRVGERYILGSQNLTLHEIMQELSTATGRPAPTMRVPYAVAYAAGMASTGWASITGKMPLAPLDAVRMARKKMWVRHDKAAKELNYTARPAAIALARAAEWFQSNGYCEDVSAGRRRTA